MERLKIAVALLIAAAMLLSLTACGDKGPDVTGKYICVGESYGGEYSLFGKLDRAEKGRQRHLFFRF